VAPEPHNGASIVEEAIMDFRITGLDAREFTHLAGMSDEELARHRAVRYVCDSKPGFPCRVSLADAEPGEEVLLVNYEHLPVDSPYRASHAIYVRPGAREPFDGVDTVPAALASRLLSVRAIDGRGFIVDADVTEGAELPALIRKFFGDDRVAYLHAHFARRGCFAARIDRLWPRYPRPKTASPEAASAR
jgi:hypothetical protein